MHPDVAQVHEFEALAVGGVILAWVLNFVNSFGNIAMARFARSFKPSLSNRILLVSLTLMASAATATPVLLDQTSPGQSFWFVPATGVYFIEASGAQGGSSSSQSGGLGAQVGGDFILQVGTVLYFTVGGAPKTPPSGVSPGGGGGTFVFDANDTAILIAGGGGGAGGNGFGGSLPGLAGSATTVASDGNGKTQCTASTPQLAALCASLPYHDHGGAAGTDGNGGDAGTSFSQEAGGGGGGLYTAGGNSTGYGQGGAAHGGAGGDSDNFFLAAGVGGGGGGGSAGGGGGGYNGGGGGALITVITIQDISSIDFGVESSGGGGGSSLNTALLDASLVANSGVNRGDGELLISYVSALPVTPVLPDPTPDPGSTVPEPDSVVLLGIGLAAVGIARGRRWTAAREQLL